MSTKQASRSTNQNGDALAAAMASEEGIAAEAAVIRGDKVGIDAELFLKLAPLLRRSIPMGFIQSLGVVTGKPYASTGIKSVQVQVNRMDNVLTQLGWRDDVEYHDGGKVARVRVQVVTLDGTVLAEREAWGGVNQASTEGNRYKGTYTNAAKVAFARLGPGHEVYVGATDLDPDVHEDSARQQDKPVIPSGAPVSTPDTIGRKVAGEIVKAAWIVGVQDFLQLAATHAHGGVDVGDCSTERKAIDAMLKLSDSEAAAVLRWIEKKADEVAS